MIESLSSQFGDSRFFSTERSELSQLCLRDWPGGNKFRVAWQSVVDSHPAPKISDLVGSHSQIRVPEKFYSAYGIDFSAVQQSDEQVEPYDLGESDFGWGPAFFRSESGRFVERTDGRFPEQMGRMGPRSIAYMTDSHAFPLFLKELSDNKVQQYFFEREMDSDRLPVFKVRVQLHDDLLSHSWEHGAPLIRDLKNLFFRLIKQLANLEHEDSWKLHIVASYKGIQESHHDLDGKNDWIRKTGYSEFIQEFSEIGPPFVLDCPQYEKHSDYSSASTYDDKAEQLIELGSNGEFSTSEDKMYISVNEDRSFNFRESYGLDAQDAVNAC